MNLVNNGDVMEFVHKRGQPILTAVKQQHPQAISKIGQEKCRKCGGYLETKNNLEYKYSSDRVCQDCGAIYWEVKTKKRRIK